MNTEKTSTHGTTRGYRCARGAGTNPLTADVGLQTIALSPKNVATGLALRFAIRCCTLGHVPVLLAVLLVVRGFRRRCIAH